MNRLILIGNGFDLAHGLKTSYNDFIYWYLRESFIKAYTKREYEDGLISMKTIAGFYEMHNGINTPDDYFDFLYKNNIKELIYNKDVYVQNKVWHPFFDFKLKSKFFEKLIISCIDCNWVDIENEFYGELKKILNHDKEHEKKDLLTTLNYALKVLIDYLESYLATISVQELVDRYRIILQSSIDISDIVESELRITQLPRNNLILNFNYTATIKSYLPHENFRINNIHGQIGDSKNRMIFGFGDELDENYLKMEMETTKGFFEYIKSFWYFKTSNYHDLIRYIDSDEFQVFILGHSCGLSDRTMLNMIFEHPNCKSIKIYYYVDKQGNNNFTALTQEISRHFKNKGDMRRKIVPFDKSEPMPQVKI